MSSSLGTVRGKRRLGSELFGLLGVFASWQKELVFTGGQKVQALRVTREGQQMVRILS